VLIKVRVFDEAQQEIVYYQNEINLDNLFMVAKSREDMIREKGREFAQGAIPFFGGEFIKAVQKEDKTGIEKSAIEAAMAAWLYDSIYDGVTKEMYRHSFLEFNLHPTGMVVFNRKPV
jgi:hypothetical protein